MRYAMIWFATAAWGLWFGGTIATFVFGGYYFTHLPRASAGDAANAMFAVFSVYQLVVGGVAIAAAGLAFVTYPSRWTLGLLATLIAAFGLAIIFGLALLPQLRGLREQGMVASDEYKRLHGQSMMTAALQALVLLGSGSFLPFAYAPRPKKQPAPSV